MELAKEFGFESAHSLPNVPEGHKCARVHGHSFRVVIHVEGPVGEESGWVMDFADLEEAVQPTVDALDHRHLNDIAGLENPTSEHIATWIWRRIVDGLPGLSAVEVRETCTNACIYRGV
ncbi:MAG: 6-carboxytetrahydropterin synthase QueD [Acidimicrobiales bacterium]|nr:6-carboxytetrahydropterin synthase QueD [Acidimicrobiales bacterium]